MTKTEAKREIKAFLKEHAGKTVFFHSLNDSEKLVYVMVKTFNYFSFVKNPSERLARAIANALAHKESNYEHFAMYTGIAEKMVIARD